MHIPCFPPIGLPLNSTGTLATKTSWLVLCIDLAAIAKCNLQ